MPSCGRLPEARFDDKVVRGKDGWLFLDLDTNQVMRQVRGELLFTAEQLEQWTVLLAERNDWLESRGVSYRFLVPPSPPSVYPDKLPFEVPASARRPVIQLLEHLEQRESAGQVVYPIERLISKRDCGIYARTNTHWTVLGAFVGYEALLDALPTASVGRRLKRADVRFREVMYTGDLGRKVVPAEESVHVYGGPIKPCARMTEDNGVSNNGHRVDYECGSAKTSTCLVLGDSYAHGMLPFLAESFSRTVFAHISTLDRELVEEVAPDTVVSVMNERFLVRVPDDSNGKSLDQWIAEKRAAAVFD
jgi:SGNH hydrolase-like domain, acetyltransferase AlgX